MDARDRYRESLGRLLEQYGVSPSSRFASIGKPTDRVHYLDTGGSGEPVVFLHGAASSAADWVPLLSRIDRRCLVLERPGHGLSPAFDHRELPFRTFNRQLLDGFLDAVDVDSATLVGNSYGGWHALTYAAAVPGRVSRLALPGAPFGIARDVPWIVRLLGVPTINQLAYPATVTDGEDAARDVYARLNVADPTGLPPEFFASHSASTHVAGRRETLLSLFASTVGLRGVRRGLLLDDVLAAVDVPTLFVWGDADFFHPPADGRKNVAGMADATLLELPSSGHMPWLEPGEEAGERLADFIA